VGEFKIVHDQKYNQPISVQQVQSTSARTPAVIPLATPVVENANETEQEDPKVMQSAPEESGTVKNADNPQ
jgi:hypothetical protein